MGYTPSVDVSHLLRLVCHALGHERDERDRADVPTGLGLIGQGLSTIHPVPRAPLAQRIETAGPDTAASALTMRR